MSSGYTVRVPIQIVEAMKRIVDMYIDEEALHYAVLFGDTTADPMDDADVEGQNGHIYNILELVNRFIHSQDLQAEIDEGEEYLIEQHHLSGKAGEQGNG